MNSFFWYIAIFPFTTFLNCFWLLKKFLDLCFSIFCSSYTKKIFWSNKIFKFPNLTIFCVGRIFFFWKLENYIIQAPESIFLFLHYSRLFFFIFPDTWNNHVLAIFVLILILFLSLTFCLFLGKRILCCNM